jgi:hypothetical protein
MSLISCYMFRGIKDMLIALSSIQPTTHTTRPHHSPTLSHAQFASTRCCATYTATVVVQSPCIPTASTFMIPAVLRPVLPPRRLTVTAQDLPQPVHDHGRCTLIFHPGRDRIHGPGCPRNSGTNLTSHRRDANCAPVHAPVVCIPVLS